MFLKTHVIKHIFLYYVFLVDKGVYINAIRPYCYIKQ